MTSPWNLPPSLPPPLAPLIHWHEQSGIMVGQFHCETCYKRFNEKGAVLKHMKIVHQGQRNFECEMCPKRFGEKGNLTKHIKTVHERCKAFQCIICEKTFGEKGNLQRKEISLSPKVLTMYPLLFLLRHIKAVHHGKKDFYCSFCAKGFAEKGNLQKHIKAIHDSALHNNNSNPGNNNIAATTNNLPPPTLPQGLNNPAVVQIQIPWDPYPSYQSMDIENYDNTIPDLEEENNFISIFPPS
ncbi:Uncharacterized protein FKW44_005418 [Caligus rogercresseyi]|uniref:C2H2-type domain-containing protein n=1 Tax=Caligus rogercresseyi TaxID=217165 RepID=A0A7T8QS00_CALRO|nr:Uncharacterized protein FKW44_005418 [Caligus rogercresseyi]